VSYDEAEDVSGRGSKAEGRSTALLRAALALSEHRELADVLSLILTSARSLAGARYAALAVYDEHGEIETFVHQGVDAATASEVGAPPRGHGLLGELIMAGGPIRVEDIRADPRFGGFPAHHPEMRSFLGVPVASSRRRYGNLYLGDKEAGQPFDAEDERLLGTLAAFAAAAIENVHLLDAERDLAAARERDRVRTEMLGQVIDAQEAERARVARDLHDEIGQSLTSVLLGLRLVEDSLGRPDPDVEDCRQRTAEVRKLVAEALRQARTLAFDLRPTVLDDLGLVAAVRRLVEEVGAKGAPAVDLAVHGLDDDSRLAPEVETVVYRVVQEALTNVVRHAAASSASVVIARDGDRLRAVVEDDGHGFDLGAAHRPSLGLSGMNERAQLVGGSLQIDAAAGRGTTVRLEVPVA
jgi:signal transduction histidine kinase